MGLEEQIIEMIREEGMEVGMKQGIEKGRIESARVLKEKLVRDLIHDAEYTDEQIMKIIQVPLKLVRDIRNETLHT